MYNTNDVCKPEREQTVYTDHENIISQLFDHIDMLETRLSRVTLPNKIQDSDKVTVGSDVLVASKSQLKSWVGGQTLTIKTAIARIRDLLDRLDID